ncbi:hypothetical protein NDU88_002824 [Pleurodeles waltl]|uniref:Uncharacterized protein n=1 Tax=Pleurodeles waltl TaxID=8319 RepID=A0AAV7SEP1_PLEWA|nr:hypothetical protein NDU88_002824 [Pleurodeles waltl]
MPRSSARLPEALNPGCAGPRTVQGWVPSPGVGDTFPDHTSALRLHRGPTAVITNTCSRATITDNADFAPHASNIRIKKTISP